MDTSAREQVTAETEPSWSDGRTDERTESCGLMGAVILARRAAVQRVGLHKVGAISERENKPDWILDI